MIGRIMVPKWCLLPDPWTLCYIIFYGKVELRLQVEDCKSSDLQLRRYPRLPRWAQYSQEGT